MTTSDTDIRPAETDQRNEREPAHTLVDFKMVTFSLGGKDYGIDIMRVKEIAKFSQFTYVPNTAPFVRGVYNLRGDIISIIDLRLMFNLPAEQQAEGQPENGLILRLENNLIGVIVDQIDKVVGISSSQVQPPHPIFGDINVKYISGVAEHEDRLYIILDVDRIFSRETEEEEAPAPVPAERIAAGHAPTASATEREAVDPRVAGKSTEDDRKVQREFIEQGLQTFAGFSVTAVNAEWFERRVDTWIKERENAGTSAQFSDSADAEKFLVDFYSRHSAALWQIPYTRELLSILPEPAGNVVKVWNIGCGSGHEGYSIAAMLIGAHPDRQVKVWAVDKDLIKVSNAPNLVINRDQLPSEWSNLVTEGKNGLIFDSVVRDSVLFEFSDILNAGTMPRMDYVVARDLLSFLSEAEQRNVLETVEDSLKPGGALILGDNERVFDGAAWEEINGDSLTVYRRR